MANDAPAATELSQAEGEALASGCFTLCPQDLSEGSTVQPYPRSPKLQRKNTVPITKEQLSKCLEDLKAEEARTEARLESLKKRRANLSKTTEAMKQQVKERFDGMRAALQRDEQAVRDALELDRRETSAKLDTVLKDWQQHLGNVQKGITSAQQALKRDCTAAAKEKMDEIRCPKKPNAMEEGIRLNEERFQNLLRRLQQISTQLLAQLQRKTLLLDASDVVIDKETSHTQISVSKEGRNLFIANEVCQPQCQTLPLQFDQVYCALGSSAINSGRHYWEVDVRCCPVWAVGVAYGTMQRKGRDKSAKLGRNRMSWCVEFRDGCLTAWHNDRHVTTAGIRGHEQLSMVGVHLNYEKGRVFFYDAETMELLQEFSAALTTVFDRVHHQFLEPLYPAVRFLKPPEGSLSPCHMDIPNLQAL